MVFHRARRKVSHNKLFINYSMVTQVSCSKFLGIILDNKLNWTSHIAYIKNKIANGMGILLKAKKETGAKANIASRWKITFF